MAMVILLLFSVSPRSTSMRYLTALIKGVAIGLAIVAAILYYLIAS